MSHFFGEPCGISQIDEHEYQPDFSWILGLSEKRVDEYVCPELLVYGTDERDKESRKNPVEGKRLDRRFSECAL